MSRMGVVASACAWAFVALSAAPVRGAVAARVGVGDHGATYTLAVDPFIQQGEKLTGSAESGEGEFGNSAALSGDGSTALIGAPDDSGGLGAVWVFTRSGSSWTQQGAKLTGRGEIGQGSFGDSVALSADGKTALIGGGEDDNGAGAVWVFVRSGSKWEQQGAKLTGGRASGSAAFGGRVALSSEGDTALIGGPGYKSPGAWVFVRSRGSRWTQQGAKLTCRERSHFTDCANSLALSGSGNTALVGGGSAGGQLGAVWAFTRSGSRWTQQGPKLTAAGEAGRGNFGEGLALSSDGDTALIGAAMNEEPGRERAGAVWLFTRSHSTWRQHSAKLTGRGANSEDELFGVSVALSSAGSTALIGGEGDNNDVGAAWVFVNQRRYSAGRMPGWALTYASRALSAATIASMSCRPCTISASGGPPRTLPRWLWSARSALATWLRMPASVVASDRSRLVRDGVGGADDSSSKGALGLGTGSVTVRPSRSAIVAVIAPRKNWPS
jgi:hypothetical protein